VALEKHSKYLDIRDHIGASPLHYASSKGYFRIIRLIAQVVGQQGNRATSIWAWIHVAVNENKTKKVIFDTAELNARDEEGDTPLHWAVQKDQPGICSVLLTLGADPNILNNSQQSPLHMAVSLGKNLVVEVGGFKH